MNVYGKGTSVSEIKTLMLNQVSRHLILKYKNICVIEVYFLSNICCTVSGTSLIFLLCLVNYWAKNREGKMGEGD